MNDLREQLLDRIGKLGLEKFALIFITHGKNSYTYKKKHGIAMTKQEEKVLMYQYRVGNMVRNALWMPCEGKRTNEMAIDHLMRLIYKKPYLRNFVKSKIM